MSRKLYEIDDEIQDAILAGVDRETGEISPDLDAMLDALDMERDQKCLAVLAYIKGLELEAATIQVVAQTFADEAQEHLDRAEPFMNQAERLRKYLARYFPEGHDKISDARGSINWKKGVPVCEVIDVRQLPSDCVTVVPEQRNANKNLIKKKYKETGERVLGSRVYTSDPTLVLK